MDDLIKEFSLKRIQKSGAIFNIERLNWLNGQYIKKMDIDELTKLCIPYFNRSIDYEKLKKIIRIKQERMFQLSEAGKSIEYFFEEPKFSKEMLVWKPAQGKDSDENKIKNYISQVIKLCDIPENKFTKENIKNAVWDYSEKQGRGNVLWPFRVALTGLEKSPDPFSIAEILGKNKTLKRLQNAIEKL